jgi:tRNA(Arg) A34 adenosine deaminase TadA
VSESSAAPRDIEWLRRAIALSQRARTEGHHPFSAILVDVAGTMIAEAMNASSTDRTAHAEMLALRKAAAEPVGRLHGATLYCSAEPCAMCAGGAYWAGVGRVVYALSEEKLRMLTGNHPENPTLSLPCREVFARGQRAVEVLGPLLESEAAAAHLGFWS